MLPAIHRLTKKEDFSLVYSKGSYAADGSISIKYIHSSNPETRLGFPVGKNVSKKAVERNRARRILRAAAIGYVKMLKPGFDIAIMLRPTSKEIGLEQAQANLKKVFTKANLFI